MRYVALMVLLLFAAPALGATDPTASADALADAIIVNPGQLESAGFVSKSGQSTAVKDDPVAGMPTHGNSFMVLSTGDATCIDGSDTCSSSSGSTEATVLAIAFHVPASHDHVGLDFRFLSEEYPAYVGTPYVDAFLATLDVATADPYHPANMARDEAGNPMTVNTASFSSAEAAGTPYNGATCLLRAWAPVTPGSHTLYLRIHDGGDGIFDSAALVDALRTSSFDSTPATQCAPWPALPPEVSFHADPADDCSPTTLTPDTTGFAAPVTYTWDFGDGQTATSTGAVQHTFAAGTFLVTLAAFDGSDTASYADHVVVAHCLVDENVHVKPVPSLINTKVAVKVTDDGRVEVDCHHKTGVKVDCSD